MKEDYDTPEQALGDTLLPSPDLGTPGAVGVNSVDRPALCPGSGEVDALGFLRDLVADLRRQRDELAEALKEIEADGHRVEYCRNKRVQHHAAIAHAALARTAGAKAPEKEADR